MDRQQLIERAYNLEFYEREDGSGIPDMERTQARHDMEGMYLIDGIPADLPADFTITLSVDAAAVDRTRKQLEDLEKVAREYASRTNRSFSNLSGAALVEAALREYDRRYADVIDMANGFRDQVVAQLRALSLTTNAVEMADTHAEKAARLRGLEDLFRVAIESLERAHMDMFKFSWFPESLFSSTRSEYKLRREVWEKERELSLYKKQFGSLPLPEKEHVEEDMPW